jgi:RNA-directed DNA polymerase
MKHDLDTEPGFGESVSTKRLRIAELARRYASEPLSCLHKQLDESWLESAWRKLRRKSAAGVDGQRVADYAVELKANLRGLLGKAKSGNYQAPPVRRVHIPKGNGKETRAIGIPTTEDKVLQRGVVMLLEPIYEEEFYDFSYGFRPGRGAHQALEALWQGLREERVQWVVEVDIRKFFDTMDHGKLRTILDQRVRDGVIRKLIDKWLSAGVMETGEVWYPEEGTPQGGIVSPLLSNIFLHEVVDKWFVETVKPCLKGRSCMVRYADDLVMGFEAKGDAERVMRVIGKRLEKYGLSLHEGKTRMVYFGRPSKNPQSTQPKSGSFDFLGFTHYWGRNQRGNHVVRRKTARPRLARAVGAIKEWCRQNRHVPLGVQQRTLSQKLLGHFGYYGITGNGRSLHRFRNAVRRQWKKWLGRRTRRRDSMDWEKFDRLWREHYPLPVVRIVHSIYAAKPFSGGTGCVNGARPDLWGSGQ